jgi:hypothetical protein
MADKGGGEHRMLFDVRGRRKRVIQVIYTGLALLMAGGLVLFGIGGSVSGGLLDGLGIGNGSAGDSTLGDQADRLDQKLQRRPNDEALLLAATRTRISYGNTLAEVDPTTGQPTVTSDARDQYEMAADTWARYLKVAEGEKSAGVALLVANALFTLAQSDTTPDAIDADVKAAARAQRIVAEQRPNVGTLSTLATFEYYSLDFTAGDRAAQQAEQAATSPSQRKLVKQQLAATRKQAKRYQKQVKAFEKANKGQQRQRLENPFGGLGGG